MASSMFKCTNMLKCFRPQDRQADSLEDAQKLSRLKS